MTALPAGFPLLSLDIASQSELALPSSALRPVTVLGYEANEVLVASGVSEGDEVITLGVQKLDAGQRVRVVQALRF